MDCIYETKYMILYCIHDNFQSSLTWNKAKNVVTGSLQKNTEVKYLKVKFF